MKAFLLANLSDVFSTFSGLKLGAMEANPMIHFFMENTSVPEALLVKLALAIGVGLLIKKWKPNLLIIPTLVFTLAAISNSFVVLTSF
ncbi:MAG: DUF5658 family protein [Dehalococcoidia bacterium]